LLRALQEAAARRGAVLESHRGADGFAAEGGRIAAVHTSAGDVPCGLAIVAAGAWSGGLLEPAGIHAPTPPIKGQNLLLTGGSPPVASGRQARQAFSGPPRGGRDPGRPPGGSRGLRRAAAAPARPRPARRGPALLSDPGPRRDRGARGRPPPGERRPPPLHR